MAITIGKTATVVLNRFCNLVLKPEPVATGGGGGTWTLNFTGGDCGSINCSTNTETIPENVTLYFEATVNSGGYSWSVYKNGNSVFYGSTGAEPPQITYTSSFNANDTLYFTFSGVNGEGTMTIRENNASGRLISNFNIYVFD